MPKIRFIQTLSTSRQCFRKGRDYEIPESEVAGYVEAGVAAKPERQDKPSKAKKAVDAIANAALLLVMAIALTACAAGKDHAAAAIGSLANATGHTEVVKSAMEKTRPRTDEIGKAYLDMGLASAVKVEESIDQGAAEVELLGTALGETKRDREKWHAAYLKEHNHWLLRAYRIAWWVVIGLGAVHVLAGVAGLLLPGTFGAILARVGVAANPLAWFQSARDNAWFLKATPAAKVEE